MYAQYIKDIERRIEEERKKQREWSHLEYENYRKKYETSVQNTSFYNEKMRVSYKLICRRRSRRRRGRIWAT